MSWVALGGRCNRDKAASYPLYVYEYMYVGGGMLDQSLSIVISFKKGGIVN